MIDQTQKPIIISTTRNRKSKPVSRNRILEIVDKRETHKQIDFKGVHDDGDDEFEGVIFSLINF